MKMRSKNIITNIDNIVWELKLTMIFQFYKQDSFFIYKR